MMMKKVTLVLSVLVVLLFMEIKGNPLIETDESVDRKDPESSRILPKADWLNFQNTWSLPSLPSVTSFFHSGDKTSKEAMLMKTRIEALEQSQKDVIKMLKKITQDIKSNSSPCATKKPEIVLPEKHMEEPILPAKPANNVKDKPKVTEKPVINENPVTDEFVKPEFPKEDKKDDKNSSIEEASTETTSKVDNATATSQGNEEKMNYNIKDTNENIASKPATRMNGRMPILDDINSR